VKKKQLYPLIVSLVVIIILIIYGKSFLKSTPSYFPNIVDEKKNPASKSANEPKISKMHGNFASSTEYADLLKDVPCKESYLIYNYLSVLLNDQQNKVGSLKEISIKLAKDGFFDKAIHVANLIEDNEERNTALGDIIKEILESEDVEKALEIANSMDKPYKNFALLDITNYLAEKGDFDKALEIANKIEESRKDPFQPTPQSDALSKIANEFMKTGLSEKALTTADSIRDWKIKVDTLKNIASNFMNSGQNQQAEDVFKSALNILDSIEIEDDLYSYEHQKRKFDAYNIIAFELNKNGQIEWSENIFTKVIDDIDTYGYDWKKKMYLRYIAIYLVKCGYYDKAIEMAYDSGEIYNKPCTFVDLAFELSKMNKGEFSNQLFKQAEDLISNLNKEEFSYGYSYNYMASKLADLGEFEWALNIAGIINNKFRKDDALSYIAKTLALSSEFDRAMKVTDSIVDQNKQKGTLENIATKSIENNNFNWFRIGFDKMLDIANSQKDQNERIRQFYEIAGILLDLPCDEQQKYIQKFVRAYDSQ
jgi:hypothetical protein